ncbi:MAG TPA: hypothetical protein PK052_10355, partial [Anaerohalosphaeraceae bacterium]|nr:hypothetical protein [Anaerohalosphaeraceae bacterium]
MNPRSVWFFILFVYILSLSLSVQGQEELSISVSTPTIPLETEEASARQLRIYRETLFQGSTEDVRVDAAVGLLLQNNAQSREVLVSALKAE